jgi:hypothetical protein
VHRSTSRPLSGHRIASLTPDDTMARPVNGAATMSSIRLRRRRGWSPTRTPGARHPSRMDSWAWEHLNAWPHLRVAMPVGALLSVTADPTAGRLWSATADRATLRQLVLAAGVRRRFAPHQRRHAYAVEMARVGLDEGKGLVPSGRGGVISESCAAAASSRRAPIVRSRLLDSQEVRHVRAQMRTNLSSVDGWGERNS